MVEKAEHSIKTKKPGLLDLGDYSEIQKISPMIALFKKLEIEKKDHVVLHFDTATSGIPNILKFILENHFKLDRKVTTKYEEFRLRGKSILVCSYATFRGLGYANITVLIDRNIFCAALPCRSTCQVHIGTLRCSFTKLRNSDKGHKGVEK